MRATPEASSGQVPEAGSGQALQCRGLKVKNEVGALATSIIYELKAFSIAEFGINIEDVSQATKKVFLLRIEVNYFTILENDQLTVHFLLELNQLLMNLGHPLENSLLILRSFICFHCIDFEAD